MEVADQWHREWAGTAEYGKVTEGGVTRRVARAMEVLHSSSPGARVRVMRAAYHSSAGPGVPASSYMLHSSRRVISSGYNFSEPPSLPSLPIKPLEISSTPLESFPDCNTDTENYKVTEPDDIEISEPSKWRGSTGASSIRMPSEESSSIDNASIIDLDSRTTKNLQRKYSYDSESSDVPRSKRNNATASPLLDAPVTLNTLKYKSLLNGSNEWNNRRKSYSFEDTSPLNETILHQNNSLAMESSTDSGICKSSEIVNDHNSDEYTHPQYSERKERKRNTQDESFKEWLSKNRSNTYYKGTKFKTYREHDIVIEDPIENNITLQSTGKVSITLPITVETDEAYQQRKLHMNDDGQRKAKKVEFCKTELHFAAESGKVNIIATDEKPPPTNDFRKRRSAFVPLHEMIERPITLFGEKNNDLMESNQTGNFANINNSEFGESDENTAATKSILKNKIPKPKPYLLGENMAFGLSNGVINNDQLNHNSPVLTAVSLINQLQSEKRLSDDISSLRRQTDKIINKSNTFRTIDNGPSKNDNPSTEKYVFTAKSQNCSRETVDLNHVNTVKNKFNVLQMSPVQGRPKTRQLRESELTYFGVENDRNEYNMNKSMYNEKRRSSEDSAVDELFHSVRLIQKISNSVCNSEADSEDASPEYQNIPLQSNYAPVPTPRLRSKYDDKPNEIEEIQILKPILEHKIDITSINESSKPTTRRTRIRRQEETTTHSNRSISEPPKTNRDSLEKSHRQHHQLRCKKYHAIEDDIHEHVDKLTSTKKIQIQNKLLEKNDPLYANLGIEPKSRNLITHKKELSPRRSLQRESQKKGRDEPKVLQSHKFNEDVKGKLNPQEHTRNDTLKKKQYALNKNNHVQQVNRDELTANINDKRRKNVDEFCLSKATHKSKENKHSNEQSHTGMKQHGRNRSSPRCSTNKDVADVSTESVYIQYRKISNGNNPMKRVEENCATYEKRPPNEKRCERNDSPKSLQKLDLNTTEHSLKPMQMKSSEKNNKTNRDSDGKVHRRSKRSEYVINYDDKNGTVSSVRKIQPVPGETSGKKKIMKESIKEIPTQNIVIKNKTLNKIALRK